MAARFLVRGRGAERFFQPARRSDRNPIRIEERNVLTGLGSGCAIERLGRNGCIAVGRLREMESRLLLFLRRDGLRVGQMRGRQSSSSRRRSGSGTGPRSSATDGREEIAQFRVRLRQLLLQIKVFLLADTTATATAAILRFAFLLRRQRRFRLIVFVVGRRFNGAIHFRFQTLHALDSVHFIDAVLHNLVLISGRGECVWCTTLINCHRPCPKPTHPPTIRYPLNWTDDKLKNRMTMSRRAVVLRFVAVRP